MTVCCRRVSGVVAALFCATGIFAGVDGGAAAGTLLVAAALSSAMMLQALLLSGFGRRSLHPYEAVR